ncbi:MAG: hypothetical protein IAF02_29075 [Anaerolineae bacterium]|nr:hypothetical protein [Anaerolineae bacterium]
MSKSPEIPNSREYDPRHPYYPFLKWGYLHTPFMIYVRSYNSISDQDFLKLLGLQGYQKAHPPLPDIKWHVVFANDSEWTHIADDFRYTLWHNPKTDEAIAKLSQSYDLFHCSIGDIDNSFDFAYYRNSKLVRRFVFENDVFKKTEIVTENIGAKLLGEPESFEDLKSAAFDNLAFFPTITQALGIERVTNPLKNRFYLKEDVK